MPSCNSDRPDKCVRIKTKTSFVESLRKTNVHRLRGLASFRVPLDHNLFKQEFPLAVISDPSVRGHQPVNGRFVTDNSVYARLQIARVPRKAVLPATGRVYLWIFITMFV
jgi:hypothetical protein